MLYMLIALAFIVGFFLGGLAFSLGLGKIFPSHRVQDELTRTKRELASARRILDEFFHTSGELYSQLDKSYRAYSAFMKEAASKLSTGDGKLFVPEDEIEVEDSLKQMLSESTLEDFNHESESVTEERRRQQAAAAQLEKKPEPLPEEPKAAEPAAPAPEKKPEETAAPAAVVEDAKQTISVASEDQVKASEEQK
ncbi:MAG: DUF1043 family protein [Succinivibrio sp.]|nr:DUF1043 family protein [Succinivibrio sp.]